MSKWTYVIFIAVAGAGIAILLRPVSPIHFKSFSAAEFTQQLTPLFLVSLLIERSLEVFLTTVRAPEAARLQMAVDKASAMAQNDAGRAAALQTAQSNLTDYKSGTQQMAMPIGMVLGILICVLGIRCLGNFVDYATLADHPRQKAWFTAMDVLLTGALVGGGADFVHQFISSITNFLNQGK
jgi:hypothetical protein